jgi:methylenetetrahydrofolate reductase (NADPH)
MGTKARLSFEFFPAKNEATEVKLMQAVHGVAALSPDFVSVTYGAGGTTRDRTADAVRRIMAETSLAVATHMTCVDASRAEVDGVVAQFRTMGVRRFVALRGDPVAGVGSAYVAPRDGYANGADLCAAIAATGDGDISVSAYPEKHPESPDWDADIAMLKRKQDHGAARALTQFFFDCDFFERYVERARAAGVVIPIVPGVLPIHNFRQVASFAKRCGTSIPGWLGGRFDGVDADTDPAVHASLAVEIAVRQVELLRQRGHDELHFYTMNRADLVTAVCRQAGLVAASPSARHQPVTGAEAA